MNRPEKTLKYHRLCKIRDVKGDDGFFNSNMEKAARGTEASDILVKYTDRTGGITASNAAYEKGRFRYFHPQGGGGAIDEDILPGWDYYPYDDASLQSMTEDEMKRQVNY